MGIHTVQLTMADAGSEGMSKSAMKKAQKAKEAAEKKAAKEAEKAAKEAANPNAGKKKKEEEELDPTKYRENRQAFVNTMFANFEKGTGPSPYPHKFHVSHSLPALVRDYDSAAIKDNDRVKESKVSIAGRVYLKRASGKKLHFLVLKGDGAKIQIIADLGDFASPEAYEAAMDLVKRGDILGVNGYVGRSKTGEFSVYATEFVLLSACMHMLPKLEGALQDQETRYRQRY